MIEPLREDDFFAQAKDRIDEARRAIDKVASLPFDDEIRNVAAHELGKARIALDHAKDDLDEQASRIEMTRLRSELPAYLERIRYGRDLVDVPEFTIILVPLPLKEDRIAFHSDERDLARRVTPLVNNTVNTNFTRYRDWFGVSGQAWDLFSDRFDYYGLDNSGGKVWGVRLYESGTVVYHTPLYFAPVPIGWFEKLVEATLIFTALAWNEFKVGVRKAALFTVLADATTVAVSVPAAFGSLQHLQLTSQESQIVLPEKPLVLEVAHLEADRKSTAQRVIRYLRALYE